MNQELWRTYKLPIIFGILGLLIAICFMTLGFLKTVLILIFTSVGIYLGFYLRSKGFFDR
ncbi:DUF2273 domain-containing protein [Enterococcus sp. ALS3]|uniref:DUF2273 domain-containing protein n=1 Tax=Enterococcus alishanensis TaxID=1303817 RepID=A0ABS6THL5_9ENTE|nr:DUF2273 domain-containing protein [Enterococcus alishanensis]MBV7392406.1 DUF2273 domain-containing protein [Enterococcus alishanensis]